ncbi:MAG TPA: hypothetical protein VM386_07030, partial [Acidimicrobiales bacterium]|nr:hypothetical protein [Acidimicrobiales bacterium]
MVSAAVLPQGAQASHGSTGSIVHIQGSDVWLTSPDGATQVRVTNDGGTPSPDGTGDGPYFSPSQTDDGNIIVAVRNQLQDNGFRQGYLWIMNREGEVISKFAPPQFEFVHTRCNDFTQGPSGIYQAAVSPDGTKIAYVDRALIRDSICGIDEITALRVIDIDGSNHQQITRPDGSSLDLFDPSWASESRLLLYDSGIAYVDLPDPTARLWTDTAAEEGSSFPVLEADKLATTGPNTFFGEKELRLWSANGGPPAPPATSRCTITDPVRDFATPTWAPGGEAVAWWEFYRDEVPDEQGAGIWAVSVGDLTTSCPTREEAHLIVPGGSWPFWGPAPVSGSGTTTTSTPATT